MKQLRGFSNNRSEHKSGGNDVNTQEMLDEAMKKYGGMDENALISQLLSNVRAQKQNGTYNEAQLLGFINNISPHLSSEQRERLEGVLGILSGENGKS